MRYGDERWRELSKSGGAPSHEELAQGWHYCPEFDEELLDDTWGPEGCQWCNHKRPAGVEPRRCPP